MVPKLRFKKFTNEWCESLLGNLVDIKSGNSPSTYELSSEGDYPFVKVEDMNNCTKYQIDAREYVINSHFCFPAGSVIFPKRGAAIMNNKVRILNQNSCADTNMMALIAKHINSEFLYYLVSLIGLYKIADTSTIPQINNKHISPFKVNIPSEEEQTKIANFLTSIDDKIMLLDKQYKLLCQYKKGIMQKFFSQKLRFKNDSGDEFSEWQTCTVGEIFQTKRGNVLATSKVSNVLTDGSPYPVYSSQTKNGGIMGYYNTYLFSDCITWTTDGANAGETRFRKGNFYCTNVCGVLVNTIGYSNQCIAEIINTVSRDYVSYVGNPKLMNNVMNSIEIRIPSSVEEQIKIANVLSTIDEKIDIKKVKIDKIKTWKQGLLQQMFV